MGRPIGNAHVMGIELTNCERVRHCSTCMATLVSARLYLQVLWSF